MDEYRKKLQPNPAVKANFLSKLFFCWVNPILRYGYKHDMDTEDLYECEPQDECQRLSDVCEREWYKELKRSKETGKDPSLFKCLSRIFGVHFMLLGLLLLLENIVLTIQPIMMGGLIRYFKLGGGMEKWEAYCYAGAIAVCAATYTMIRHPYFYAVQKVGMRLRVACSAMIFRKAMRLSNASLQKATVGHIVNLLSNDVARFDLAVCFIHNIWISPIAVIGFIILLYRQMGPSCLAGFGCMILLVPIQGTFSRLMGKFRAAVALKADKRVSIMSEILNGIRVIKMYAWEKPFSELIDRARGEEMGQIRRQSLSQAMIMALFYSTYHLVVLCAVVAYVLTGNVMSAEVIFVAAALFNSARLSVTLFLPFALMNIFETKVTLKRITDFLMLEENPKYGTLAATTNGSSSPNPQNGDIPLMTKSGNGAADNGDNSKLYPSLSTAATKAAVPHVYLNNFTAQWDKENNSPTLSDINLRAERGQLITVIGPVGSGKSSILSSILGELVANNGTADVNGKLAYVPQEAWVFSATVRQNVTFGMDMDKERYQKTLNVCALKKDLALLGHGDSSMVGDRGVALSGGQKARLNLARAVYRDADIYLLDDPLSAVDASVGRFLFEKCIREHLKDKIRILITHQLQYLPHSDYIIVLKDGRIVAEGEYEELRKLGDQFMSIVKETEESYEKKDEGGSSVTSPITSRQHSVISTGIRSRTSSVNPPSGNDYKISFRGGKKISEKSSEGFREGEGGDESGALLSAEEQELVLNGIKSASMSESAWSLALGGDKAREPVAEEDRNQGAVTMSVYADYFKHAAVHPALLIPLFIFFLMTQILFNFCDYWLNLWANQAEYDQYISMHNVTNLSLLPPSIKKAPFNLETWDYLKVYTGLILLLMAFSITRAIWFRYSLTISSFKLHNKMFSAILRSPVAFFDRNPVGRVLNRFSKDLSVMDEQLGFSCFSFCQGIIQFLAVVTVVGMLNPTVFIPTVPLGAIFAFVRFYYLRTGRQVKRLEATARSPVFTHVSASLNGLSSIRAFGAEKDVIANFFAFQDVQSAAFGLFLSTMRWFSLVVDWLSAGYVAFVAFLAVYTADEQTTTGGVALSLFYSIQLLGLLAHYMNEWANVESTMVSVERIISYSHLTPESPLESPAGRSPKKDWPRYGEIYMDNVNLQYGEDGPKVLKDVSLRIKPAEKIGIVGRTGAGKSSLLAALFRLTQPTGTISIDGLDTASIGLWDLRTRISIIPQDPVLFIGTLRKNLDPFEEYPDVKVWDALEQVQLKSVVKELPGGLDTHMQEGGANLSVGQKQLVCLARALLKQARILVIDEATANVDLHTDALIQEKIRTCFSESTVMTIAHRLNTIMDSDRVMVLADGSVIEFDSPHLLLERKPGSVFRELVEETGGSSTVELERLAKEAFDMKNL